MNLRIDSAHAATPDEWDEAWRRCGYATYFHGRAWAEIWSGYTSGRLQPAPQRLRFSDGSKVLLPLTRERLLGGLAHRTYSSPAGTYGGWLADAPLSDQHAQLLMSWLRQHHPTLQWRQNPYAPAPQRDDLSWKSDHTHTLDLTPTFEGLVRRWSKGHRSAVGKATRSNVTVRRAVEATEWRDYHEVYLDSQRRWGDKTSSRYGLELFEALRVRAERDGGVELWLALHEQRVIAGALCLYSPRIAVYWHGAALESHFEIRPVNLLLHEAIRDARSRGLDWFDFNPSGGHAGVETFKRSFGTQQKSADILKTEARSWRLMQAATRLLFRRRSQ